VAAAATNLRLAQRQRSGNEHNNWASGVFACKNRIPRIVGNRNSNWDFYVQDDWKVTKNLTLNLGLRYDYNTVWTTGANQGQNFDIATQPCFLSTKPHIARQRATGRPGGFRMGPDWQGKDRDPCVRRAFLQSDALQLCHNANVPALASYNVNVFSGIFANPPFSIDYPSPNPPLIAGTQNVNAFPRHPKDRVGTKLVVRYPAGSRAQYHPDNQLRRQQRAPHAVWSSDILQQLNANPANPSPQVRQFRACERKRPLRWTWFNYNALQAKLTPKG